MRKRWITVAANVSVALVATVVALNIGSYLFLRYVERIDVFDKNEPAKMKELFFKHSNAATFAHPYLGLSSFSDQVYTNDLSNEPLFFRINRSPNSKDIKVLILGGSVAAGLNTEFADFAPKLNAHFNTDRFSVFTAAYPGYKQPQQYLKLIYLDLLGFRPDIVLNYDGFNEIALPVSENRPLHNPAIFPRLHSMHLVSLLNRSCANFSNRLLNMESRIPLISLITYKLAKRCDERINNDGSRPWWVELFNAPESEEYYAQQSAAIWRASSNRIYELTKMRGIDYIEVIQPDQHYPNSKIWSEEERRINDAQSPNPYADAIRKYYHLISRDGVLAENFLDQRYLFKNNSETLYIDFCCHLNRKGFDYVIEDILTHFNGVFQKHLVGQSASAE